MKVLLGSYYYLFTICFFLLSSVSPRIIQISISPSKSLLGLIYLSLMIGVMLGYNHLRKKKYLTFDSLSKIFIFFLLLILIKYLSIQIPIGNLILVVSGLVGIVIIALLSKLEPFVFYYFKGLLVLNSIAVIVIIIFPTFGWTIFAPFSNENFSLDNNTLIPRFSGTFSAPGLASYYFSGMFAYFLNMLLRSPEKKLYFLYGTLFSFIAGFFTLNRSFFVVSIVILLLSFICSLGRLKSTILNKKLIILFIIGILIIYFKRDIVNAFFDVIINRFDEGIENRLYGSSGFEYSMRGIFEKPSLFGNLVYTDSFYIKNDYHMEQPHNGIIFFISAFGLILTAFLLYFYKKLFISAIKIVLIKHRSQGKLLVNEWYTFIAMCATFLAVLGISLTESFIIEPLNILTIFSVYGIYVRIKNDFAESI